MRINPSGCRTWPSSPRDRSRQRGRYAKKSQNPLANMIALPLQNNTNFGAGPQEKTTTNDLNIQPVVPVGLGKVLLINRVVLPISYQGEFVPDRSINPPPSIVPPDQLGTKTGLGVHRVVRARRIWLGDPGSGARVHFSYRHRGPARKRQVLGPSDFSSRCSFRNRRCS